MDGFSDEQLTAGFEFTLYASIPNTVHCFWNNALLQDKPDSSVLTIKQLYSDCFAPRYHQTLGHLSQEGTALNSFCYMLWDESPLGRYNVIVTEVMRLALTVPNIACVESGLHGLGHYCGQNPTIVQEIIDNYLSSGFQVSAELRQYALQARTGIVL